MLNKLSNFGKKLMGDLMHRLNDLNRIISY
jgi:hypothetical protein